MNMTDFSAALFELKGGNRIARSGWNGKGMWLTLVRADELTNNNRPGFYELDDRYDEDVYLPMLPWIGMKTADNKFVPWLASQTDLLTDDWVVL